MISELILYYLIGIIPALIWLMITRAVIYDYPKIYGTLRDAYSVWNYKNDYEYISKCNLRPIFTSILWLLWIIIQVPVNIFMLIYGYPIILIIKSYEKTPTESIYHKLQNGIKFIFKGN